MNLSSSIDLFLEKTTKLRVLVIGETITDAFVKVHYEGHSMKSFCPVFRIDSRESETTQEGGALAIANHLKDFVAKVDVVSNAKNEIIKRRYLDANSTQKHVEINLFNAQPWEKPIPYGDYDLVIVADFGHGFCDSLQLPDGVHLMCQTNSNNFGFNRVSKWKNVRKASVCLDLREASLQMNRNVDLSDSGEIVSLYNYELNTRELYITLGKNGATFTNGQDVEKHPAFKTEIVDTIGAGDAFFAFACLMSHLKWPARDCLALPSLAASLTTTWLANAHAVNRTNLKEHATRYL